MNPSLTRLVKGLLTNGYLPECKRVRPHIAQVGQGVEEGHVGASDSGVRDPGKESHDGEEPCSIDIALSVVISLTWHRRQAGEKQRWQ